MNGGLSLSIFAIEIDGKPTLAFETNDTRRQRRSVETKGFEPS